MIRGAFLSLVLFIGEFNDKNKLRGWLGRSPRSWSDRASPQTVSSASDSPLSRFGQVCDEPHPLLVKEMIQHCVNSDIDEAYKVCLLPPLQGTFQLSRAKGASCARALNASLPLILKMMLGVATFYT